MDFKNDSKIEELYEIVPKEELLQCDIIKNLLIPMEDKMKWELNISKDVDLILKPYKNQQSF